MLRVFKDAGVYAVVDCIKFWISKKISQFRLFLTGENFEFILNFFLCENLCQVMESIEAEESFLLN